MHDVDAFWLQRAVAQRYPDPVTAQKKAEEAMGILGGKADAREAENELMELFDYEHFDLVKVLARNRATVVWGTRLAKAGSGAEREQLEAEMEASGDSAVRMVLVAIKGGESRARTRTRRRTTARRPFSLQHRKVMWQWCGTWRSRTRTRTRQGRTALRLF